MGCHLKALIINLFCCSGNIVNMSGGKTSDMIEEESEYKGAIEPLSYFHP